METIRITARTSSTTTFTPRASSDPSATLLHDFAVPAAGTFCQLRHDFENPEWDYEPRSCKSNPAAPNAAGPEMVPFLPFNGEEFVPLTAEMQWFHFGLLARANPGLSTDELKARWRALTVNSVVFTDKHYIDYGTRFGGSDLTKNYADYILGVNLDNPTPIATW